MTKKKKYYACLVPAGKPIRQAQGKQLITDNWADCERLVSGVPNARYKSFESKSAAERWLAAGAKYGPPRAIRKKEAQRKLEPGIYFDAGTGRGDGVEISVTDEKGRNLLDKILLAEEINKYGKHLLDNEEVTNNFGELLACRYALQIAIDENVKKVFGDSKLVIDYWSKGFIKRKEVDPATVKLAEEVTKVRNEFELVGGLLGRISGDINPADLGFHK